MVGIHARVYACKHAIVYAFSYIPNRMHTHRHALMNTYVRTYMCAYIHTYIHTTHMHTYIHACMYAYNHAYIQKHEKNITYDCPVCIHTKTRKEYDLRLPCTSPPITPARDPLCTSLHIYTCIYLHTSTY